MYFGLLLTDIPDLDQASHEIPENILLLVITENMKNKLSDG